MRLYDRLVKSAARKAVAAALAEDLGKLGDITSLAVIPEDTPAVGAYIFKAEGVVAGVPVIEEVCRQVSDSLEVDVRLWDGQAARSRRRRGNRLGPGPRDTRGGARVAQLLLAPLRRRDAYAPVRGRRRRHRGADLRHAKDHAGPAGPRKVRSALRRRGQPPHGPLRPGARQGQPHRASLQGMRRGRARGGAVAHPRDAFRQRSSSRSRPRTCAR